MRLRHNGDDRDLSISSGFLRFPDGEWVDVEQAAQEAGIPVEHAVIAARAVLDQPGWEQETKSKKPTEETP